MARDASSPSPTLTENQIRGMLDIIVTTSSVKRDNIAFIYFGLAKNHPKFTYWLHEYYRHERKAEVRRDLVRFAGKISPASPEAVDFLIEGLADTSYWVRESALVWLAYSQSPTALAALKTWKPSSKKAPRNSPYGDDATMLKRAIRAIEKHDIQEWVKGTIYSEVAIVGFSDEVPGSAESKATIDRSIKQQAPELVSAIEAVLGSVYVD